MICCLVRIATWARWCFRYCKTIQICLYVPMSHNRGCEVVGGRYFHFQSFGHYQKIVFCDFTLGRSVPVSLPLVYTVCVCARACTRVRVCVCARVFVCVCVCVCEYTGCPRRNVPDFGRAFFMLKHLYPKLNGYGDNSQISLKL
jgi:hypothetical protein